MTHITCRLTAKNRDQLRNPTLGNRVWATFTFTMDVTRLATMVIMTVLSSGRCRGIRGKTTNRARRLMHSRLFPVSNITYLSPQNTTQSLKTDLRIKKKNKKLAMFFAKYTWVEMTSCNIQWYQNSKPRIYVFLCLTWTVNANSLKTKHYSY